ncbi:hypothetical protein M2118_001248 [Aurantimicrobium minutum]|nr:hypothetical protein [Aurantimicrobium minutum]
MSTRNHSHIIGYLVEPDSHNHGEFTGTAEINGQPIQHLLTPYAQPGFPIDVGRNENGDLVWVSERGTGRQVIPALSANPSLVMTFDPPRSEQIEDKELPEIARNPVQVLVGVLSRRRMPVIASAVSGVVLVVVGLGLTSTPTNSTEAMSDIAPSLFSSQQPDPAHVMEPTQAAIEFVLAGQVPGFSLPSGVSRESLTATVVSTSGEIVLVDVHADQAEGLTTFATLLLQKSGTAWRIREVFDPR